MQKAPAARRAVKPHVPPFVARRHVDVTANLAVPELIPLLRPALAIGLETGGAEELAVGPYVRALHFASLSFLLRATHTNLSGVTFSRIHFATVRSLFSCTFQLIFLIYSSSKEKRRRLPSAFANRSSVSIFALTNPCSTE